MIEHPKDEAFVDFAIGGLELEASRAFEAHVAGCDACSERLAREARLELTLGEVAQTPAAPVVSLTRRRARRAIPFLAAAAAAAAIWAAFAHRAPTAEASGPIPNVVCSDGPAQAECVAKAERHGLFVAYPVHTPRFDVDPAHPGWSLVGGGPSYELGRDRSERHGGSASAMLASRAEAPDGAGVVAQAFDAQPWRGKKVRFTAFVKTEDLHGWAGLFVRADRPSGRAAFDNMQDRPLRGSNPWAERAVVLEVPEDATSIAIGLLQDGAGKSFIDDARFELASDDTPLTSADQRPLSLSDGDFEKPDLAGWFLTGLSREQFGVTLDTSVRRGGRQSARLAPVAASPSGYGVLMQSIRADGLRGKRLRLRAWVRGEGITGRGELWTRVQAVDSPADGPGLGFGQCKLEGSFDFRICEMVLDVAPRADALEIGMGLGGPGTAWLDDVTLEVVDPETPLAIWKPMATMLDNGDFEAEGSAPRSWLVAGKANDSYALEIDRTEHHGGAASGRLSPKPGPAPRGYGTMLQHVVATSYRGKRLRGVAWVKGEGIGARGDVWMRVQAADSPADGGGLGGGRCVVRGTFAWQPCAIVFDVPRQGAAVQVGAGVDGPGRIWLDDVTFEEVDTTVPVTNPRGEPAPTLSPAGPTDLDFERSDAR